MNANADYIRKTKEIKGLITKIEIGFAAHAAEQKENKSNWGFSGDLDHYKSLLREISDSLFHEGEYAD